MARRPPVDPDAEVQVLGSMMLSPSLIDEVVGVVAPEDFSSLFHERAFRAIMSLHLSGDPVDVPAVARVLESQGGIPTDGRGRLAVFDLVERTASPGSALYHARTVADAAAARRLIVATEETLRSAYDFPRAESIQVLLDRAVIKLGSVARLRSEDEPAVASDFVNEAIETMDRRVEAVGVPTGFRDLDNLLFGLHRGSLVVVAARPGVGKSAFVTNVARHAAGEGIGVLFFSLEMSTREIGMRLICGESRVSWELIRADRVDGPGWKRVAEAAEALFDLPLYVVDSASTTVVGIRTALRRHPVGLVIVDYLQLMRHPSSDRSSRQEEVAEISRSLKVIAKDFDLPVLAVSQLNRNPETRSDKRPALSDLRESGAIEQDADVVMLLHRSEDSPGKADVIVAKHRNGPTDTVPLSYLAGITRFVDYVREERRT